MMHESFHETFFALDMDGYLPLSATSLEEKSSGHWNAFWTDRRNRSWTVSGRLKPGVTVSQAPAWFDVVAERLAAQYPETDKGVTVRVLLAAWALTRAMSSLLIGVSATEPITYVVVALVWSAVSLAACWIPARRALRVDPLVAIR
jgi:hypothetical protein